MEQREHTIDASNQPLGHVASEAAVVLMGKDKADFERHVLTPVKIRITNASHMRIRPTKAKAKTYIRYSGHPGGQKRETLEHLAERRGYEEVLKRAIRGMLPANKLRPRAMKNLIIES